MHERFPQSTVEPEPHWIPGDIGEVLNSEVFPSRDDLYGWGEAHEYGPIGECRLGLYPEHQTLVYEDLEIYLVIKKPARLTLTAEEIWVDVDGETRQLFLTFPREGGVVSVPKPRQLALDQLSSGDHARRDPVPVNDPGVVAAAEPITETLVSEVTAPWETEDALTGEKKIDRELNGGVERGDGAASTIEAVPVDGAVRKPAIDASFPSPSVEPTTLSDIDVPKKKANRLDIKGRLEAEVRCRTTNAGKTIARFPVAEHTAGQEHATWYTVVAFNAIADELCAQADAGKVTKGDVMHVVGYQTPSLSPDGREENMVFAAMVKRSKGRQ